MTLEEMKKDTRFLIFRDENEDSYGDTELTRNLNSRYREAVAIAFEACGGWEPHSDKSKADIEEGRREYPLPSDMLKLDTVYIKYGESEHYLKANPVNPENLSINPDKYPHRPYPPEYDLFNNSIFIYTPEEDIQAVSEGLIIYYHSDLQELSDDGDTPDFPKPVRRYLTIGAAYDFFLATGDERSETFKRDLGEMEERIRRFFSRRSPKQPSLKPKRERHD